MGRLVFFILTLAGLAAVYSLRTYQDIEVDNKRFDFEKAKESHAAKVKQIAELEEMRKALYAPKITVMETEEEKPLVVLDTPELERGAELYKKCIVCHGKRGEGKKAQNAPAIGGQYDWYVVTQLNNMKNKTRINKIMDPYINKLEAKEFSDLAAYISKLPKNWTN